MMDGERKIFWRAGEPITTRRVNEKDWLSEGLNDQKVEVNQMRKAWWNTTS